MHPYDVLREALDAKFPDWNNLGGHNCRPKRGSTTSWSDHAYLTPRPHALDIGVPDLAAPINERLVWGDAVLEWLNTVGYARLGIRYVIWRDGGAHEGHHLHVSFLPNQRNKLPACKGGAADLPAPDIAPLDIQEEPMPLRKGDRGRRVVLMQIQINDWRRRRGKPEITEDGIFGPGTEQAVRSFQEYYPTKDAPDGVWEWHDATWAQYTVPRLPGPKGDKGDPGPPGEDADPQHRHGLDLGDTTGPVV